MNAPQTSADRVGPYEGQKTVVRYMHRDAPVTVIWASTMGTRCIVERENGVYCSYRKTDDGRWVKLDGQSDGILIV
jgi:hypothetical protein